MLLLLEHPHVYTLGKRREAAQRNILADDAALRAMGATVETCDRGGDVTYHGPGQLVGYPIMDLRELPHRSVRRYVESLEDIMIGCAGAYGIQAHGRRPEETGAWVGDRKLGAIGVRVHRWVTTHGFALNVSTDLDAFRHILPCGLADRGVTSLHAELTRQRAISAPSVDEVAATAEGLFCDVFDRRQAHVPFADLSNELARVEAAKVV